MGVDFQVITAIGYCVNVNQIPPQLMDSIQAELEDHPEVSCAQQDLCAFDNGPNPQMLIYLKDTKHQLCEFRVGMMYPCDTQSLRGFRTYRDQTDLQCF